MPSDSTARGSGTEGRIGSFLRAAGALALSLFCVLSGLRTIAPGVARELGAWYPPFGFGYVMFNRMPNRIVVTEWRRGSGPYRTLGELIEPPALGYADARAAFLLTLEPGLLRELCRDNPKFEGLELRRTSYFVDANRRVDSVRSSDCVRRELVERP